MFGPGCVSVQDVCLGHLFLTLKNVVRVRRHAGVQACACVRVSAQVRVPGIRACLCPHLPRCCGSVRGPVCPPAPCFSLWMPLCLYTCVCVHGCGPCILCACISAHVGLVFPTSVRACAPFCAHLCPWMCWCVRLRGVGAPARVCLCVRLACTGPAASLEQTHCPLALR